MSQCSLMSHPGCSTSSWARMQRQLNRAWPSWMNLIMVEWGYGSKNVLWIPDTSGLHMIVYSALIYIYIYIWSKLWNADAPMCIYDRYMHIHEYIHPYIYFAAPPSCLQFRTKPAPEVEQHHSFEGFTYTVETWPALVKWPMKGEFALAIFDWGPGCFFIVSLDAAGCLMLSDDFCISSCGIFCRNLHIWLAKDVLYGFPFL